jgi:hypothetical protein
LVECEGCGLVECIERGNECLKRISTEKVRDACRDVLNQKVESKTVEVEINVTKVTFGTREA